MTDEPQTNGNVATRRARHYINDMLEEAGFDPEKTSVSAIEYVNGELRVVTERQDSTIVQRVMAEAVCTSSGTGSDSFSEVKRDGLRATFFNDGDSPIVEADRDGQNVGSVELDAEQVALIRAASELR